MGEYCFSQSPPWALSHFAQNPQFPPSLSSQPYLTAGVGKRKLHAPVLRASLWRCVRCDWIGAAKPALCEIMYCITLSVRLCDKMRLDVTS